MRNSVTEIAIVNGTIVITYWDKDGKRKASEIDQEALIIITELQNDRDGDRFSETRRFPSHSRQIEPVGRMQLCRAVADSTLLV